MTTNKIEIKDLTVNYTENRRSFNALHNVSFGVTDGEFVSVPKVNEPISGGKANFADSLLIHRALRGV